MALVILITRQKGGWWGALITMFNHKVMNKLLTTQLEPKLLYRSIGNFHMSHTGCDWSRQFEKSQQLRET